MSVSTTGYDFLMAVADQCNHRDIKAFIIEQFKCSFDQNDIDEILDEAKCRPDGIDIYRLTQELESQIKAIKDVQNSTLFTALSAINEDIKQVRKEVNNIKIYIDSGTNLPVDEKYSYTESPSRKTWHSSTAISEVKTNDGA